MASLISGFQNIEMNLFRRITDTEQTGGCERDRERMEWEVEGSRCRL